MSEIKAVKLEFLNTTAVVLAQQHNPAILHPYFLQQQNIVPKTWQVNDEGLVCTPVFSKIEFVNGITFIVEPPKMSITDSGSNQAIEKSKVTTCITKYTTKLPHVFYTAMGINFKGFVECLHPEKLLMNKYLKASKKLGSVKKPTSIGLKLVYPVDEARLTLSIDAGKVKRHDEPEREGLVLAANYHMDFNEPNRLPEIKEAAGRFEIFCDHFRGMISDIVLKESK